MNIYLYKYSEAETRGGSIGGPVAWAWAGAVAAVRPGRRRASESTRPVEGQSTICGKLLQYFFIFSLK